jgi:hypothetical protein
MTGIPPALRQRRPVPFLVVFLCLFALGLAPQASAAGPGFFSPTGSMSVPRSAPVAAPLPDGRVLVAGGIADENALHRCYLSTAEVFDPATNSFSSAGIGSMSRPRAEAVAAPLPDGVLVAGGYYAVAGFHRGCPDTPVGPAETTAEIFRLGVPPVPPVPPAQPAPRASCRGKRATVVGTNGADHIAGTRGANVIVGLGGNDKLRGLAGNDVICGGAGKDTLKGGKGNDKLYGEAGGDTIKGGPGKDKLKGGAGKDKQVQ